MKMNDIFPSKYVKAADIKGKGDVSVVITDVQIEKLGDDQKLVLYFQGKEKGLVTNKTNAGRIEYLYGDDTDGWIGKEIALGVEFVEFQGRTVEAIRVKAPAKRISQAAGQMVNPNPRSPQITTMQPADDFSQPAAPRGSMKDQLDEDEVPF